MQTLPDTTTIEEWNAMRRLLYPDGKHQEYDTSFFIEGAEIGTIVAAWYQSTGGCKLTSRRDAVRVLAEAISNRAFNALRDNHGLTFEQAKVISSSVLPHRYNDETAELVGYSS